MGFGLKKRTADYDARTARTIAAQDAYNAAGGSEAQKGHAMFQARKNFNPETATGNARIFLNRTGGAGYNPSPAQDDRPFTQRLLTSPASTPSPNPYSIGPFSMDKPLSLPPITPLGFFMSLMARDRSAPTVAADTDPMRERPDSGYNLGGSAQPGTRFYESTNVPVAEFEAPSASILDTASTAIEAGVNPPPLATPSVYDPNGDFGLRAPSGSLLDDPSLDPDLTLITSGPHAGKYVDKSGRLRMP